LLDPSFPKGLEFRPALPGQKRKLLEVIKVCEALESEGRKPIPKKVKFVEDNITGVVKVATVPNLDTDVLFTNGGIKKRGRRSGVKREPSLRSRLLAKLRARLRVLSSEVRGVKRDIKSLTPRRKK